MVSIEVKMGSNEVKESIVCLLKYLVRNFGTKYNNISVNNRQILSAFPGDSRDL